VRFVQRHPRAGVLVPPRTFPHAGDAPIQEGIQHVLQLIHNGNLADGRAIEGINGTYTVRVQPPLEVTDEGIVLNTQDPTWGIRMRGMGSNNLPVVVSSQVAANVGSSTRFSRGDHIHNHELVETGSSFSGLTVEPYSDKVTGLAYDVGTRTLSVGVTGRNLSRDQAGHAISGSTTLADHTVVLPSTWTATDHNLLDGDVHPDTTASGPSIGSLVVGQDTPTKWKEFNKTGSSGTVLTNRTASPGVAWAAPRIHEVHADSGGPGTLIHTLKIEGGTGISTTVSETDDVATVTVVNTGDGAGAGSVAESITWVKVHYKSLVGVDATITTEVSSADWRARHLMWWAKEDSGGDPQYLDTDADNGSAGMFTYGEADQDDLFGTCEITGVGSFYMTINDADGHLNVVCANPGQIEAEAVYCIKILYFGDVDVTGTYQDIGDGH